MNVDDMRALLSRRVAAAGGQRAFGKLHGDLDPAHIGRVMNGKQKPGPAVLDAIGLEEVPAEPTYRRKSKR
jgi:hypothetical protein